MDRRALPKLARSVTLAEIEASICYWRGQGCGYFSIGLSPGEEQAQVLEQLYARLLGGTRAITRSA